MKSIHIPIDSELSYPIHVLANVAGDAQDTSSNTQFGPYALSPGFQVEDMCMSSSFSSRVSYAVDFAPRHCDNILEMTSLQLK